MEVEAKFALPDEAAGAAILDAPLVQKRLEGDVHTIRMESAYYRDGAGRLDTGGFTLRLRRENGRGVCCLKQDVSARGALKVRHELECPAETIEEGVRGLIASGAPQAFADAVRDAELVVAARVRFVRRALPLAWDGVCAELAFDAGTFGTERPVPFYELELEWKSGPEEGFRTFLHELAQTFALAPQKQSKYARAKLAERDDAPQV